MMEGPLLPAPDPAVRAVAPAAGARGRAGVGPRRLVLCLGVDLAAGDWRELEAAHWRCHPTAGVESALQAASAVRFDALLVAIAALGEDWGRSLAALRAASCGPLLVLADPGDAIDEILALEVGADDYLVPPFSARRLRARLLAAVRKPAQGPSFAVPAASPRDAGPAALPMHLERAGWSLDLTQGLLRGAGHELRLSLAPAHILGLLLDRAGQLLTRAEIARHFGRPAGADRGRSTDMQMHHLRRRLAAAGIDALRIDTVHGLGYLLHLRPPAAPATGAPPALRPVEAAPPRLAAVN